VRDMNETRSRASLDGSAEGRLSLYNLKRLTGDDFAIADKKLRGTFFGSADYGHKAVDLAARDQAQHAAGRAGQHGPIGIFFLADFAGVFQHKDGSGLHVFRDPLVDQIQFADHISPW